MNSLKTSLILATSALFLIVSGAQAQPYLAFVDGGTGNQAFTGNLGNDFTVNSAVSVTSLCAFNSTGAAFAPGTTITVGIYSNPGGVLQGTSQTFTNAVPGTLVGIDRCIAVTPFTLAAGNYSVVAVGFNATDQNGNSTVAGFSQSTNAGPGLLTFPGTGRYDANTALDFPTANTGAFTFNAGSFQFLALPPTISKTFALAAIDINQVTTLTFNIANPNTVALSGVAFTDTLPVGLVVATPNNITNTCGGTVTAAAGSNSIVLANGGLAASAACVITVDVVGFSNGALTNTTGAVSATESGAGLTATAPITVRPFIDGEGIYQLRYLANLSQGDSYVNFTNAGTLNGFDPAGRICVNVYTFDPAEELISCCACPVTPNGLNSLSARNDLISNTLTPGVPTSITVKLLATVPGAGGVCNAATPTAQTVVRGLRSWATTLHLNTSGSPAVGYQATETPFARTELSVTELGKLTSFCAFIQANGSGFGICKSCRAGGLGATQH